MGYGPRLRRHDVDSHRARDGHAERRLGRTPAVEPAGSGAPEARRARHAPPNRRAKLRGRRALPDRASRRTCSKFDDRARRVLADAFERGVPRLVPIDEHARTAGRAHRRAAAVDRRRRRPCRAGARPDGADCSTTRSPSSTTARTSPTRRGFPGVDVIQGDIAATVTRLDPGWNTFIVVATRGHKLDAQCLRAAVATRARYVGLLGSQRKTVLIEKMLREEGVGEERAARRARADRPRPGRPHAGRDRGVDPGRDEPGTVMADRPGRSGCATTAQEGRRHVSEQRRPPASNEPSDPGLARRAEVRERARRSGHRRCTARRRASRRRRRRWPTRLMGCMAMDVVHILQKGRHGLRDPVGRVRRHASRRAIPTATRPCSSTSTSQANVPDDAVARAIDLSRSDLLLGLELAARGYRADDDVQGNRDRRSDVGRSRFEVIRAHFQLLISNV